MNGRSAFTLRSYCVIWCCGCYDVWEKLGLGECYIVSRNVLRIMISGAIIPVDVDVLAL